VRRVFQFTENKVRARTVVLIVAIVSVVLGGLFLQGSGVSVRRQPLPLEAPVARAMWKFMVPAAARAAVNPTPLDAETLIAARSHWADHCASCHGNSGDGDMAIGRNVFPPAPDMRAMRTQELTDGELFYAIEHGIPFTAMPAWGTETPEGELQSWALVRFIRHLPVLTPDELKDMERFNPKSLMDIERNREIDDFLKPPKKPGSIKAKEKGRAP
jgi:mono/diheme cytochrome c family protein